MKSLKRSSQAGSFDDSREHDVVDHCDHPMVAGFADLWHGKRGSRAVPDRADFEFEELAPWFGHVIIMDMLEDAADFRYRLVGTAVTGFLNRDYTGRTVMESNYSGAQQKVLDTFRRPAREGRPVFRRGYVIWAVDKSWRTYQSVHCPITAGGTGIAMTIGVLYFSLDPVMAPDGLPRDHWG
ncbi:MULTISPECIES: PAS domain-containing protein [Thalassobaculum]|uniref:PAS domain-containing protein n=1 Tax=Thalassobaculum litoreum DSM 18839 TaxID=1123362 RepID=A0A8G2F0R0_9PROT|nr:MULTISPECIES: PAS domain-containing protein [Thalassobaculum]SDG55581.1 PAS domain-containing protein [Thalassobaculum litoreum DSM 18839]